MVPLFGRIPDRLFYPFWIALWSAFGDHRRVAAGDVECLAGIPVRLSFGAVSGCEDMGLAEREPVIHRS